MPEREDIQAVGCDAIVEEIADATHVQATDLLGPSTGVPASDSGLLGQQCDAFLNQILRRDRLYNLVACDGARPEFPGPTFETEELLCPQYKGAIPSVAPGGFIRFNPVAGPGSGKLGCHCDRDIAAFNYVLIESDCLPLELQATLLFKLLDLGFPIASAVHTGGKSIHALIRLSAPDHDEFRTLARRVYARLVTLGFDPSTSNPSRMTRLPGCVRTFPDKSSALQQLLYLA